MAYRPPGRSNRSGRTQNDNDVFEGLPVKQWGQQLSHVSLAPPKSEATDKENDKWAEPPMPRDYQLLQPWTQALLRLARSGKVGSNKRKSDPDSMDEEKPEEEVSEEAKANAEDRGYVAKKWKPVPEAMLEPEHKHFEFLAKRRKGLPSLYGPEQANVAPVPMRKTKVQRIVGAEGEIAIYEVLVPEGQRLDGEISPEDPTPAIAAAPGTVIEGLGIANEGGVVVAEHLLKPPTAPRRNRPPPKKKGGPGRGKKRVTFTNPDGSTYTTVVPNATKIVPQPGQTVRHVAKGMEANPDVSATQAQQQPPTEQGQGEEGEGEGEGSDEGDDEEGDDDEREEGELSEDDGREASVTPMPKESAGGASKAEDTTMEDAPRLPTAVEPSKPARNAREASSSPETPLAKSSHSRQSSLVTPAAAAAVVPAITAEGVFEGDMDAGEDDRAPELETFEDGEEDLLGNLEKSLGADGGGGGQ
ncbi:hypothetical protein LTR37_015999 [Vermiconidia calcicola]|uniref:Uncharacterized protein n=1 Tax=Vermiconidia calcicola TaxID=1690605 RepID=A0ACC3MP57_9PEZI|nr:hypothetical protein LTR37_015999 [Vermiconidia calcicola]